VWLIPEHPEHKTCKYDSNIESPTAEYRVPKPKVQNSRDKEIYQDVNMTMDEYPRPKKNMNSVICTTHGKYDSSIKSPTAKY
jgi:hypothetical protein